VGVRTSEERGRDGRLGSGKKEETEGVRSFVGVEVSDVE
jgi:hypothetical protein